MVRKRLLSSFIFINVGILLVIGTYCVPTLAASALVQNPTETIDYCGQDSRVRSVAFSPDGKYVSVLRKYDEVPIWDVQTGKRVRTLPGSVYLGFEDVAFSPDGRLIAAIASNQLVVWDVQTGKELQRFWTNIEDYDGLSVSFTPDNRYLFTASEWGGMLWDVQAGELVYTYPVITVDADPNVALSSDGKYVLTAGDRGVRLWDLQTGLPVHDWAIQPWAEVGFSPDGKYIIIKTGVSDMSLWDATTFRKTRTFNVKPGRFTWQFAPNSRYLLVEYDAIPDGSPRVIWDVQTGQKLRTFTFKKLQTPFAVFLPDSEHVLVSDDEDSADSLYTVWNIRTGKPVHKLVIPYDEFEGGLSTVGFSPDGQYMVGGEGRPRIWSLKTFEKVNSLC